MTSLMRQGAMSADSEDMMVPRSPPSADSEEQADRVESAPATPLLPVTGLTSSSKEIIAGSSSSGTEPRPERATDASEGPGLCMDSKSLASCWLPAPCLSCSCTTQLNISSRRP